MARYTGPKSRIARKFGEGIFGADKVLSKKNYPPGQHGNNRRRKTFPDNYFYDVPMYGLPNVKSMHKQPCWELPRPIGFPHFF